MRLTFTVAPIAFGIDKFFNVLVDWPNYLAPWINDIAPGTGQEFMYFVGVIEILAGVAVALKPRYGAYIVAAWLAGIVINLLTHSGFYDIALRDFGLMLGRPDARSARRRLRPAAPARAQLSKRIHRKRVAPEGATRSVVHSAGRDLLVARAEPPRVRTGKK